MDYILTVFNSVTAANRAQNLAKKAADYAAIVQLPPNLGIRGCNYCLRTKYADGDVVSKIARQHGLTIRAAFVEKEIKGQKVYEKL